MKTVELIDPPFWFVPVAAMARIANPLATPPWEDCREMSRALVERCVRENLLEDRPWDWDPDHVGTRTMQCRDDRDDLYHAKRIAYLVKNPSPVPIDIEVPMPSLGYFPDNMIVNGFHRLAAAIFRRDRWIALRYSGEVDEFYETFSNRRRPDLHEIRSVTRLC